MIYEFDGHQLDTVRFELRPKVSAPKAPNHAGASREEFTAALVHRPEPRRTQPDLSM